MSTTDEKIAKLHVVCGNALEALRLIGEASQLAATSVRSFNDTLDEQIRKAARGEE